MRLLWEVKFNNNWPYVKLRALFDSGAMTSVTRSEVFDLGVAEKSFADPHIIAGLDARDQHCVAGRIVILGNDGIAIRISVQI